MDSGSQRSVGEEPPMSDESDEEGLQKKTNFREFEAEFKHLYIVTVFQGHTLRPMILFFL